MKFKTVHDISTKLYEQYCAEEISCTNEEIRSFLN